MPKEQKNYTLDQYFKLQTKNLFTLFGFSVETEKELITGAKRIDVVLITKDTLPEDLKIFDYFLEHNLLSYKSFADHFSLLDVRTCMTYYGEYLNMEKEANRDNTTITLIISKKPQKLLSSFKDILTNPQKGIYKIRDPWISLTVVNIEEAALEGVDGVFLSAFCKTTERMASDKKVKQVSKTKKIVARLLKVLYGRLRVFEGVQDMGAVADITEIVKPHYEKGIREGIEKGKEKGIQDTAKRMLDKGFSLTDIIDITGLSKKQIESLKK